MQNIVGQLMAAQLFYMGSFAGVRCRCTVMMLNSVFRRYGEPRFVVLLLREHLRMPGKDLSQIKLARWEKFCFVMLDLPRRWGWMRPTWANPQPMGN